jgi:hypothetical protein
MVLDRRVGKAKRAWDQWHLVNACTDLAQESRYNDITLWSDCSLAAACRLYERAGYLLLTMKHEQTFKQELVNETWELRPIEQG